MNNEQNDDGRNGDPGLWVPAPIVATTTGVPNSLRTVGGSLEAVAFWVAVLLPLAYPPVMILDVWQDWQAVLLGGLLLVHLCALALGHRHGR